MPGRIPLALAMNELARGREWAKVELVGGRGQARGLAWEARSLRQTHGRRVLETITYPRAVPIKVSPVMQEHAGVSSGFG